MDQLYKHIIATLPHAILVLDEGLRVIVANRSCESLVSKSVGELVGVELFEIIPHTDLCTHAQAVLHHGGTKVLELYLNNEQRTFKVLRAVIIALPNRAGLDEPLCLITLEDIGERVRLEEELVHSEKLAGMGLLARNIAHEIGNPLAIMASTLQYIRDTLVQMGDRALTEAIGNVMESVDQIHELLQSLSEFNRAHRLQFEPTDLGRVLSQILSFIHSEAERHHIRLSQQFDRDLPCCEVDPGGVRQLLLNLFKNAIEAMPHGGELRVTMGLAPTPSSETAAEIQIEVSDTGVGISETAMRSIFKPFYSTKPGGTGLGLSFCRQFVEEHGGEIMVTSRPGQGSTFSVRLPVKQMEEV